MSESPIDRDDLLWLAGLVDGGSSFSYHKHTWRGVGSVRYYYYPQMHISSPDVDFIKMARAIIGKGSISYSKKMHYYRLTLKSNDAVWLCRQISPFLRRRSQRQRAGIIVSYDGGNFVKNEELYLAMRDINRHDKKSMV